MVIYSLTITFARPKTIVKIITFQYYIDISVNKN